MEGLAGGAPANGTPNEAWLSLDLLETLARLSTEGGNHAGVRAVLEAGAQAAPEVLLLGFVQARADWGVLGREVRLFLSEVRSLTLNPKYVLARAHVAPEVLLLGFVQACANWGVLGREVHIALPQDY